MISPDGIWHDLCDMLIRAVKLTSLVLVLEEPLLATPGTAPVQRRRRTIVFWARASLAVGVAVGLAEMGKAYEVWPHHPLFPSGHMAFTAAAMTVLILQRGRVWLWIGLPIAAGMAFALVFNRWHSVIDVAAASALGPAVGMVIWRITRKLAAEKPDR